MDTSTMRIRGSAPLATPRSLYFAIPSHNGCSGLQGRELAVDWCVSNSTIVTRPVSSMNVETGLGELRF